MQILASLSTKMSHRCTALAISRAQSKVVAFAMHVSEVLGRWVRHWTLTLMNGVHCNMLFSPLIKEKKKSNNVLALYLTTLNCVLFD